MVRIELNKTKVKEMEEQKMKEKIEKVLQNETKRHGLRYKSDWGVFKKITKPVLFFFNKTIADVHFDGKEIYFDLEKEEYFECLKLMAERIEIILGIKAVIVTINPDFLNLCEICHKRKAKSRHHIKGENGKVITLCYSCHREAHK